MRGQRIGKDRGEKSRKVSGNARNGNKSDTTGKEADVDQTQEL
jgi:hypothetical protein